MAKVRIFCWWEGNGNVGHSSMLLIKDRTYISFWPTDGKKVGKKKAKKTLIGLGNVPSILSESYEEDRDEEGKAADFITIVRHLDKNKISQYWRNARYENYNVRKHNCSSVVMGCLYYGSECIKPKKVEKVSSVGKKGDFFGAFTPESVYYYAKQLNGEI